MGEATERRKIALPESIPPWVWPLLAAVGLGGGGLMALPGQQGSFAEDKADLKYEAKDAASAAHEAIRAEMRDLPKRTVDELCERIRCRK